MSSASAASGSVAPLDEAASAAVLYNPVPHNNRTYADKAYWEERFSHESSYEWLTGFEELQPILTSHIHRNDRILVVGCGNSELSGDLYRAGYEDITNIDFSSTVIQRQRERHAHQPRMKWLCMDMLAMTFPPSSFTVVLDKCTMDALTTREGSPWSPSPPTRSSVHLLLSSISALLPPGGRYIQVSFSQPHFRLRYLHRIAYRWTIDTEQLPHGLTSTFIFTATKGEPLTPDSAYRDGGWSDDEGEGDETVEGVLSSDDESVLTRIQLDDTD